MCLLVTEVDLKGRVAVARLDRAQVNVLPLVELAVDRLVLATHGLELEEGTVQLVYFCS